MEKMQRKTNAIISLRKMQDSDDDSDGKVGVSSNAGPSWAQVTAASVEQPVTSAVPITPRDSDHIHKRLKISDDAEVLTTELTWIVALGYPFDKGEVFIKILNEGFSSPLIQLSPTHSEYGIFLATHVQLPCINLRWRIMVRYNDSGTEEEESIVKRNNAPPYKEQDIRPDTKVVADVTQKFNIPASSSTSVIDSVAGFFGVTSVIKNNNNKIEQKSHFIILHSVYAVMSLLASEFLSESFQRFESAVRESLGALQSRLSSNFSAYRQNGYEALKIFDLMGNIRNASAFVKWLILLDILRDIAPTSRCNDSGIAQIALTTNALEIAILIRDASSHVKEIVASWLNSFLSSFAASANKQGGGPGGIVSWALLRLSISNFPTAHRIIASNPQVTISCLDGFLPSLSNSTLEAILSGANCVRTLRDMHHIVERNERDIVASLGGGVVSRVLSSHSYVKPSMGSADNLEELRAMVYFLLKLPFDKSMVNVILNHESFLVAAIGHLSWLGIAEELVIKVINAPEISSTLKEKKIVEFKNFIQRDIVENDQCGPGMSAVLTRLLEVGASVNFCSILQSALPTSSGKGLASRLKQFAVETNHVVLEMERSSWQTMCLDPAFDAAETREFIWKKRQQLILNATNGQLVLNIFSMLWIELVKRASLKPCLSSVDGEKILSLFEDANVPTQDVQDVLSALSLDNVRTLFQQFENEVSAFPELFLQEACMWTKSIRNRLTRLLEAIDVISNKIMAGDILPRVFEVLIRNPTVLNSLRILQKGDFDYHIIYDLQEKMERIRGEWHDVLIAFRDYMPQHPGFMDVSLVKTASLQKDIERLEELNICDWVSPALEGNVDVLASKLKKAQSSSVYQYLWSLQIKGSTVAAFSSADEAFLRWVLSIEESMQSWKSFLEFLCTKKLKVRTLVDMLEPIVLDAVGGPLSLPQIPIDTPIEGARNIVARYMDQTSRYFDKVVEQEVDLAFDAVGSLDAGDKSELSSVLRLCFNAVLFKNCAHALKRLCVFFNCTPSLGSGSISEENDSLAQFFQVICDDAGADGTAIEVLLSIFERVRCEYPVAFRILPQYPDALLSLLLEADAENGFLALLGRFSNVSLLNQMVARLINEVEPRMQEVLHAFQEARGKLSLAGKLGETEFYRGFIEGRFSSASMLCEYLFESCGFIHGIRLLTGCVSKLVELIDGSGGSKSTRTLVRRLMKNGTFTLCLPNAQVTARCEESPGAFREVSAVELGDIPFHLCLSSNSSSAAASLSSEGVEDSYQDRFLALMEGLSRLSSTLVRLATAGHPDYQEGVLRVPGSIGAHDLQAWLDRETETLNSWQLFLSRADVKLPLLTLLSRQQLVVCIASLHARNGLDAFANVVGSVCHDITAAVAEAGVRDVLGSSEQQAANNSAFICCSIHQVLEKFANRLLPTSLLRSKNLDSLSVLFQNVLTDRLRRLRHSDGVCGWSPFVTVLKLAKNYHHHPFICALFISLRGRLPASCELLLCSDRTSEVEVVDFLRKWSASNRFADYLSVPSQHHSSPFLFVMLNCDTLKPSIQSTALGEIYARRNNAGSSLVLCSSGSETATVLCAGLRADWESLLESAYVEPCRQLCTAAFNAASLNTLVYSSETPSSGKTFQILRDHFPSTGSSIPYANIPLSEDFDRFTRLLRSLESEITECKITIDPIIHLGVSNDLSVQGLNDFLLSFIVMGSLKDSCGNVYVRNRRDKFVLELSSEGVLSQSLLSKCILLQSLKRRSPELAISLNKFTFLPCIPHRAENLLQYVANQAVDEDFQLGLKMAIALFDVTDSFMPHRGDIPLHTVPDSAALYALLRSKCSATSSDTVFRYARFLSNQLLGLYNLPYYLDDSKSQEATDDTDGIQPSDHSRNYRRLVYHLGQCSHDLALLLSAASLPSLTKEFVDNDSRLDLIKVPFVGWRNVPFLIFPESRTHEADPLMLTFNGASFLGEITKKDTDPHFCLFVKTNMSAREASALAMCRELSDSHYSPEKADGEHALKILLPAVGEGGNFGLLIFAALQKIRGYLSADAPLSALNPDAVEQLRNVAGVDALGPASTVSDFTRVAGQWFKYVLGASVEDSAPFVLTLDGLLRLLLIKLRLACDAPIVFVGETGCGKTHLIGFYSRVSGSSVKLVVINVHGGMTPEDLKDNIMSAVRSAQGKRAVILLDEVNSMPCVWAIKELIFDRRILGISVPPNIRFISIMNPRRRRKKALEMSGLDFSPYQQNSQGVGANASTLPLIYEVNRCPEAMMSIVMDFGLPSKIYVSAQQALKVTQDRDSFPSSWAKVSEELIFGENLVNWMTVKLRRMFDVGIPLDDEFIAGRRAGLMYDLKDGGDGSGVAHFRFLRCLLIALLKASQDFLRVEALQEVSAASLRDIARAVALIPFMICVQERSAELDPASARRVSFLYFKFLGISIQVSFVLNYALRLSGTLRQKYFGVVTDVWRTIRKEHARSCNDHFLPSPLTDDDFYTTFDRFATTLCGYLALNDGIAINEALKENVASLFCSIMGDLDTGTAQFIVGRPGSTKSSSLDVLCASTDPNSADPRTFFFRKHKDWKEIRKFVLQCTPDTTAADITRVSQRAATFQKITENCRCVIVLEEVGVTVGSVHNPLMVLHGLVDRGVLVDGEHLRLPIVGISNWRLDASKMNRMRTTHRGNPSVTDLMNTAECIMRSKMSGSAVSLVSREGLRNFSQVFSDNVLKDENQSQDIRDTAWFYGMRDFYAFVQLLQVHTSIPLSREVGLCGVPGQAQSRLSSHLVRWAAKLTFGGHPDYRLEKRLCDLINRCFFTDIERATSEAIWLRREDVLVEHSILSSSSSGSGSNEERFTHICDMCARIAHYTDLRIDGDLSKEDVVDTETDRKRELFNRYHKPSNRVSVCNKLDDLVAFPTLKILSYCLNIQSANLTHYYRIRHVLLFTRASAALRLLKNMGVVSRDTKVIFGRVNPTTAEVLDDLLQIRRCMLGGLVLVLSGARHLYESLYDALNQHYTAEGEGDNRRYFTRLTMNGYTTSFPIHSSFRCISIEQESTCRELLPPFINRFTKAHLNYDSALTGPQVRLSRAIKTRTILLSSVDQAGKLDTLSLLIPGFTVDTIDSLVINMSDSDSGWASNHAFTTALSVAFMKLYYLFSPRRLLQLELGLFELPADDAQRFTDLWGQFRRSHSLHEDVRILKELYCSDIVPEPHNHIFILTEQCVFEKGAVFLNVESIFDDQSKRAIDVIIDLSQLSAERDVLNLLSTLSKGDAEAYIVCLIDCSQPKSGDIIDRFLYLVDDACLPAGKHIALISVVQNSSKPGLPSDDDFLLHFHSGWMYLFVDELHTREASVFYQGLAELLHSDDHASHLLADDAFCAFAVRRALNVAQIVASDSSEVQSLAEKIVIVFSDREESQIPYDIAQRVLAGVQDLDALSSAAWKREALKRIRHTDSLRYNLENYLATVVETLLLHYATYLFAFHNFDHSLATTVTRPLFQCLFATSTLIPRQQIYLCGLSPDEIYKATSTDGFLFANRGDTLCFPFSYLLYHSVCSLAMSCDEEAMNRGLSDLCGGWNFSADEHFYYIADIVGQMGVPYVNSQFFACLLARIESVDVLTICRFHVVLQSRRDLVDALIRYCKQSELHFEAYVDLIGSGIDLSIVLCDAGTDSDGLLCLDIVQDIVVIAGDSFCLRMRQAVAVATALSTELSKAEAATVSKKCGSYSSTVEVFQYRDATALSLSKYLFPILLSDQYVPQEETFEAISILLRVCIECFDALPKPSVAFCFRRFLDHWISTPNQLLFLDLFLTLRESIENFGINSSFSTMISRCIFDLCDTFASTIRAFNFLGRLEEGIVRDIFISGAVTAGLDILCETAKTRICASKRDVSVLISKIEDVLAASDDTLLGGTLYVLRNVSARGVERQAARDLVEKTASSDCIPPSILNHLVTKEYCSGCDISPLNSVHDFAQARGILVSVFTKKANPAQNVSTEALQAFGALSAQGQFAAIASLGFLEKGNISVMAILAEFTVIVSNEPLRRILNALIKGDQLNPVVANMTHDMKMLWVIVMSVLCETADDDLRRYFSDIVSNTTNASLSTPFPAYVGTKSLDEEVHRFLHASSTLASALVAREEGSNHLNSAAAVVIDMSEVEHHRRCIQNDILTTRCPSPACRAPFDFWTGCFKVECLTCHVHFCGWCLKIPAGDVYAHLRGACPHSPRAGEAAINGTEEEYQSARKKHAQVNLTKYLDALPEAMKLYVLDSCLGDIKDHQISLDSLGASNNIHSVPLSLHRMIYAVSGIKSLLFREASTDEPVIKWLTIVGQKYLRADMSLSRQDHTLSPLFINTVLKSLCSRLGAPHTLITEQELAAANSSVAASLAWNNEREAGEAGNNGRRAIWPLQPRLANHFLLRTRITMEALAREVSEQGEKCKLIKYLLDNHLSFDKSFSLRIVSVLRYAGELILVCKRRQMSREMARRTTLRDLALEEEKLGGRNLVAFCSNLKFLYDLVDSFECKSKHDLDLVFGSLIFDEHLPLIYILPRSSDEVTLLPVIMFSIMSKNNEKFRSLGLIQNEAVELIAAVTGSPRFSAVERPFSLTENDIVTFDTKRDLLYHISLYVESAASATFTADLYKLQWIIGHSEGVWGKAVIRDSLPEFEFYEDRKKYIFGKLERMVGPSKMLTKEMQTQLAAASRHDVAYGPSCIAFLTLLSNEISRRPPAMLHPTFSELVKSITIPMTEEQKSGMHHLCNAVFASELNPQHIIPLVALLWGGGVINGARQPLDDVQSDQLRCDIRKIRDNAESGAMAPALFIAVRRIGMQYLSLPQEPGFLSTPFLDFLESLMGDMCDYSSLKVTLFGTLPVAHFEAVLAIVDDLLSPTAGGDASGASDAYEVSLADLHQYSYRQARVRFSSAAVDVDSSSSSLSLPLPPVRDASSLSSSSHTLPPIYQQHNVVSLSADCHGNSVIINSTTVELSSASTLLPRWEGQRRRFSFDSDDFF